MPEEPNPDNQLPLEPEPVAPIEQRIDALDHSEISDLTQTVATDEHTIAARDMTNGTLITGDQVYGDKVGGDKVLGNKTVVTPDLAYDVRGLPNPYLGLQSFTYAERQRYTGRKRSIDQAVEKLTRPSEELGLLFVTGSSGSGKSSFVQAGLLPTLEQYYVRRGITVRWAVFRPSRQPLAGLLDALLQLKLPADTSRVDDLLTTPNQVYSFIKEWTSLQQVNVIVLDQFEELFTQADPVQRDALFALLAQLPPFCALRTHVIITLRSDYLPDLFAHQKLYEVAKASIDLRAMSVAELRLAIQRPLTDLLERQGRLLEEKRFEDALLDKLAHDAADDAAYLPLLQVTLEDLWTRGSLKLSAYQHLTEAIQRRAEAVYTYADAAQQEPRSEAEQATIRAIFLDLIEVTQDDDAKRDVRRRRTYAEVTRGLPERVRLVEELVQVRLLSRDSETRGDVVIETVDIIHEALITNWGRLQDAIAAQRQVLQRRAWFEQALREWLRADQDVAYLLEGVRLAEAETLAMQDDVALRSDTAHLFLARSIAKREDEQQRELAQARALAEAAQQAQLEAEGRAHETRRNLRRVAVLAGLLLIVLVVAGWFWRDAEQRRRESQARALAARATVLRNDQIDLALLLILEANRMVPGSSLTDNIEVRGSLLSVMQASPHLTSFLRTHLDKVNVVAFLNDTTLVLGCIDGTIVRWDLKTQQQILPLIKAQHEGPVRIAVSRDGTTVVSSGNYTIRIWDLVSGQQRHLIESPQNGMKSISFSPDGSKLATGSWDETIILWDVATGQSIGQPLHGHAEAIDALAFSPDSRLLASGHQDSGLVILWDVNTHQIVGEPIEAHQGTVGSIAFSPDGQLIASGGKDNLIRLWDVATQHQIGDALYGHSLWVSGLAFSPDGHRLASSAWDGSIRLWDVATRRSIGQPLKGHTSIGLGVAFSPDGTTLASTDGDQTVILWDATPPLIHGVNPFTSNHVSSVTSIAFSPKSDLAASGSSDGTVTLWDLHARRSLDPLPTGHSTKVGSLAFSPDSRMLASGSDEGMIVLWDIAARRPLALPITHRRVVSGLAFSPDGTILAAGGDDGISLWDVKARQQIGALLPDHKGVVGLAFSMDGTKLVASGYNNSVTLWDVAACKRTCIPLSWLPWPGAASLIRTVAFSPDGKLLAGGGDDHTVRLWDARTFKPLGPPLRGHASWVRKVLFSPDGKLLASGTEDGTIRLWDVTTRAPVNTPLSSHPTGIWGIAFSLDSSALTAWNKDGSKQHWKTNFESLRSHACQIVARNLTPEEWEQYLPGQPYHETCRT